MDGGWVEVAAAAARRVMLWKSCWINLHFHHCLSFSLPSLPQMSGKRSRSFKCAVHQRDREITSENDFHILLQQPPFFERWVLLLSLMKSRHFDSSLGVYCMSLQNGSRNRDGSASGGARQEVLRRQLFVLSAPAVCDIRYPGRGEYRIIIGSWFWNYLLVPSLVLDCWLHRPTNPLPLYAPWSRARAWAKSNLLWGRIECWLMHFNERQKRSATNRRLCSIEEEEEVVRWHIESFPIVTWPGFVIEWMGQHVFWWFILWCRIIMQERRVRRWSMIIWRN